MYAYITRMFARDARRLRAPDIIYRNGSRMSPHLVILVVNWRRLGLMDWRKRQEGCRQLISGRPETSAIQLVKNPSLRRRHENDSLGKTKVARQGRTLARGTERVPPTYVINTGVVLLATRLGRSWSSSSTLNSPARGPSRGAPSDFF